LNSTRAKEPIHIAALPPLPNVVLGRYKHHKGGEYEVLGVARHSETGAAMVVYRPITGSGEWWVRDHSMFFEQVRVNGAMQPRFELIDQTGGASAS
jgi:hypothetical protein